MQYFIRFQYFLKTLNKFFARLFLLNRTLNFKLSSKELKIFENLIIIFQPLKLFDSTLISKANLR